MSAFKKALKLFLKYYRHHFVEPIKEIEWRVIAKEFYRAVTEWLEIVFMIACFVFWFAISPVLALRSVYKNWGQPNG